MKSIPIVLCLSLILFSQCTKDDGQNPVERDENKIEAGLVEFGQSNHALAFDLFNTIVSQNQEAGKNIVVSPLSIQVALQMVLNGADKETYEAIAKTIHGNSFTEASLNAAYKAYIEYLDNADDKAALVLANAVFWDDQGIFPSEDFSAKMLEFYKAELSGLSFQEPSALATINEWVNTNTNGRIEKILEEIKQEEVMFLINALYFIADWQNPFPVDATYDRNFKKGDGNETPVPTMSHDANLLFYKGLDFEAVDLTFGDSAYSMTFLRPASDTEPVDDFIANFSADKLDNLYQNGLEKGRVNVYLPKFVTEYKITLNEALRALGMAIAFNPFQADLTRLGNAPEGNLYISRVEHKTYLSVDEKGAEGAAVTSVGVGVTSLPPVIDFNRPFMFVLRDIKYNAVVFIGKIEDPTE